MTMPIKFDTLEYAKKLIAAGVPQTQAEAQSQALQEALIEGTVTPGDLLMLKTDMIARIEMLKQGQDMLKLDVEALKHKLTWLAGSFFFLHAVEIGALAHIIGRLP
ncbi:hypothetical protein [Duganella callida]|uniref:DUF1640 domain-containing protein n=1 Tax=Duganella callida TaxID=2561932 RepID=A0A4Y9SKK1_9BURK|nr:hypothetical protein [Duganella callida]TFW21975.1 hypothetical protein E4L98_12870 [Duganella callida]